MNKFKAKKGATFGDEKAQLYGATLKDIKDNNGKLTPNIVVEEASKKSSPIHDYFEWDNDKASDKFRLHQARLMINHIVEVVVVEGVRTEMKSFFNVTNTKEEKVYITLKEATTTPTYGIQVINDLIKNLEYTTNLMKMFKKLIKK